MSKKCPGVQPRFGKMSKKCQKLVWKNLLMLLGHFGTIVHRFLINCRNDMAVGRLSFCPEVRISGHQSLKSEPPMQKSKPTSRLLTSPQLTSPHLTSPQLTSAHLSSPQLSSPHLTSRHLTSPHVIATATHPSMKESTQGGGAKRRPPVWIP